MFKNIDLNEVTKCAVILFFLWLVIVMSGCIVTVNINQAPTPPPVEQQQPKQEIETYDVPPGLNSLENIKKNIPQQ